MYTGEHAYFAWLDYAIKMYAMTYEKRNKFCKHYSKLAPAETMVPS
jgi:hypothetical protein